MSAAAFALQAALHARLLVDTSVCASLGNPVRLYDGVPDGPVFPYAVWARWETENVDADATPGEAHAITLNVWSHHYGRAEMLGILEALRAATHKAELTLAGHRLIALRATFIDSFRAPDGRTMFGVLRLRARTEPL